MFLANLAKDQKLAFLNLAHALIAADGLLSREEVSLMKQYEQEMKLSIESEKLEMKQEQAICVFKVAPVAIRKQVIFELVALACVDNEYAVKEDCLLNEFIVSLDIDATFLDECRTYINKLADIYKQVNMLVSE